MTLSEARKSGGKAVIKPTIALFVVVEVILLFLETKGDFANGIIFFLEWQLSFPFILFVIFCMLSNYILAIFAGPRLLIKKANYISTAFLFGITLTILILSYHFLLGVLVLRAIHIESLASSSYILKELLKEFAVLFIPCVLSWVWTTQRMQTKL